MSEYVSLLDKFREKQKAAEEAFKASIRVKVAEDVLKTISGLTVKRGKFVYAPMELLQNDSDSKKLAKTLQKTKKCEVCALGACFLSVVKLDNNFDGDWTDLRGAGYPIMERLEEFFDRTQIVLIEYAFELGGGYFSHPGQYSDIEFKKADAFGNKYENATKRLEAIMKNIIKNKGTFKP